MNYLKRIVCSVLVCAAVLALATPVSAQALKNHSDSSGYEIPENIKNLPRVSEDEYPGGKVPLYNQRDYPDTPYGNYGTVSSHGCGITVIAMVATYLTGTEYLPDQLAEMYGDYNTEAGSYLSLFEDSAEELGLGLQERTKSWKKVQTALENGQVVISQQKKGLFTKGGHFIVLTGLTKSGRITVNDPNGDNYTKNDELIKGFAEGFAPEQIKDSGAYYWIYEKPIVNICGSYKSFGLESDVITIELIAEGDTKAAYVFNNEAAAINSGSWSIEGVVEDVYIVKVSKLNHVTREYTVFIGNATAPLNVELSLPGDSNGDGVVSLTDYVVVVLQAKNPTGNFLEGYAFQCCDINHDGMINFCDSSKILSLTKRSHLVW